MLSFLTTLTLSGEFDDHLFVVFSCKENIKTRLKALTETWFKQIPEVHVYLDDITQEEAEYLVNGNDRVNIIFHTMPDTTPFLIGTSYDTPLYKSRIRNILALSDIYKQYPNKKWYYFGQDDSYLLPHKYAQTFNRKNWGADHIYGHSWYFFDSNYRFIPREGTKMFYDIHPGYAITNPMLKKMSENAELIFTKYASPLIEEELKVTLLGDASVNNYYKDISNHLTWLLAQSNVIKSQKERGYIGTDVCAYSYMGQHMRKLYGGTYCEWKSEDGIKQVSFEYLSGQRLPVEFATPGGVALFTFGYYFKPSNDFIFSTSPISPVFSESDRSHKEPIAYTQAFGEINVTYSCDPSLNDGELAADGLQGSLSDELTIRIRCPAPTGIVNKEQKEPQIVEMKYTWK